MVRIVIFGFYPLVVNGLSLIYFRNTDNIDIIVPSLLLTLALGIIAVLTLPDSKRRPVLAALIGAMSAFSIANLFLFEALESEELIEKQWPIICATTILFYAVYGILLWVLVYDYRKSIVRKPDDR